MQNAFKMSKAKEKILEILDLYKCLPCLWDKSHKDYKNQRIRNEAYKILFDVYKQIDERANVKDMTKKLQNLRTNYIKEARKVKNLGNGYEPTLYYYDAFSFLNKNNVILELEDTEESSKDATIQSSDEDTDDDNDGSSKIKSVNVKKYFRKRPRTSHKSQKTHGTTKNISTTNRDEMFEVYGKAIGLQLRNLDRKQLTIAQKLISDAIYYANMGRLSENSSISLGQSNTQHSENQSYFVTLPNTKPSQVTSSTSMVDSDSPRSTDPLIKVEPENNRVLECEKDLNYFVIDQDK